jgi:3-isopropylmalate/(R)-2-methylmalate dehydratase small subunit
MTHRPPFDQNSHRVWKFGENIDTDALAPGAYMKLPVSDLAKHCLESIRPEFAGSVKLGDMVIAGANFGIGSSREQAASCLIELGVKAVIAPSYSGLFFRNAFNLGLLLLTCPTIDQIHDGDYLQIHTIEHAGDAPVEFEIIQANEEVLPCSPIPHFLMKMIQVGGLMNVLKIRSAKVGHAKPS